jgi:hypothetical protein
LPEFIMLEKSALPLGAKSNFAIGFLGRTVRKSEVGRPPRYAVRRATIRYGSE